jgi:hypothetical protein
MRKTFPLTMVLLGVSAWAIARQDVNSQNAPSSNPGQGTAQPSSREINIDGCLGGSPGNFTVTDKKTGATYQLQLPPRANTSNLQQHMGEEVAVRGTTANTGGSNPPAGSASARQTSINVTSMDTVTPDACKAETPGTKPK